MPKEQKPPLSTWLTATSIASTTETSTLHWIDTITKRLQNHARPTYARQQSFSTNLSHLREVIFADAIHKNGFYKVASLYRAFPQALGYKLLQRGALALQPPLKMALGDYFQSQSLWIDIGSGIAIGGTEAFFLLPLDFYKTRAQTYNKKLVEKGRPSPFTGFGPTLVRNTIFISMMSVVTDSTMNYLVKNGIFASPNTASLADPCAPNEVQKNTARGVGFGTATLLSNPLDVIKVRMQAERSKNKKNALQVGKEILQKEGTTAFLKGLVPKTAIQSFRLTFFFGLQDLLLKKMQSPEEPQSKTLATLKK